MTDGWSKLYNCTGSIAEIRASDRASWASSVPFDDVGSNGTMPPAFKNGRWSSLERRRPWRPVTSSSPMFALSFDPPGQQARELRNFPASDSLSTLGGTGAMQMPFFNPRKPTSRRCALALCENANLAHAAQPAPLLSSLASLCYNFSQPFRDRLIGRTSAFGAEYPGSSPGPGTIFCS